MSWVHFWLRDFGGMTKILCSKCNKPLNAHIMHIEADLQNSINMVILSAPCEECVKKAVEEAVRKALDDALTR